MPSRPNRTALVLAGGGTRGAYEVGVIHYMRTMLPPHISRALQFPIYCGSSVGAINSAFLAGTAEDTMLQGKMILKLWQNLRIENIYRTGAVSLGKLVGRSVLGISSHLLGIRGLRRPDDRALHFRGFFDTTPFFHYLRENCPVGNIGRNIQNGLVQAVAVAATNMLTGDLEMFLQKSPNIAHTDRILTHVGRIGVRHIMASAALPLLFPPVPIHGIFYNDGGMRLNTPLAPAVSLRASRILILGTRHQPTREEMDTMAQMKIKASVPTLGEVLGKLYHAILLDRIDADRAQLDRINRILQAIETNTTPEMYRKICEDSSVEQIETLSVFPSVPFSTLVDETVKGSFRKLKSLGSFERFILRLLEADPKRGNDFLTYFLFEPAYLQRLIDLGFEDARRKHHELLDFAERTVGKAPI